MAGLALVNGGLGGEREQPHPGARPPWLLLGQRQESEGAGRPRHVICRARVQPPVSLARREGPLGVHSPEGGSRARVTRNCKIRNIEQR